MIHLPLRFRLAPVTAVVEVAREDLDWEVRHHRVLNLDLHCKNQQDLQLQKSSHLRAQRHQGLLAEQDRAFSKRHRLPLSLLQRLH